MYEQKLNLSLLENIDDILNDFYTAVKKAKREYIDVDSGLKNDVLYVIGYEDANQKVKGISANFRYYKTEMLPKVKNDVYYSIGEELENHIKEMIQLENGISLESGKNLLILNDEDAEKIEENPQLLEECKVIYISSAVFLNRNQQKLLSCIKKITIPDYYFEEELIEVGEL